MPSRVWGLVGIFCLCFCFVFSATHGSNTAFFWGDSSIIFHLFCSKKIKAHSDLLAPNSSLHFPALNDTFEVLTCKAPLGQLLGGSRERSGWQLCLTGFHCSGEWDFCFPEMSCWQKQLSRAELCKSLIDSNRVRLRAGWKIQPHEGEKGSKDKLLLCLWSCGSKWN